MSGERSEKASPRRKQKAREDGDRPRSRDLLQAAGVFAGALALHQMAAQWASQWKESLTGSLALARMPLSKPADGLPLALSLRHILIAGLSPFVLVLVAVPSATVVAAIAQNGGFSFHPAALAPKWSRLSPAANLENLVSLRALTRLAKSLLPVLALLWLAMDKLKTQSAVPAMSLQRLPFVFSDAFDLLMLTASIMLAWGLVDYAVEWRSWASRLRMSKQELREEYKESEGNPQMRGRIRLLQRQMRRRKARVDVSRATVVITNPTHFAVALSFDFNTMDAPKVLAKGRDLLAEQIKTDARWAGVPIVENPPLARSLYRAVEPGQSIPADLYAAVAAILAFLYRKEVEDRMRRESEAQAKSAVRKAQAAASAGIIRAERSAEDPAAMRDPAPATRMADDSDLPKETL